MKRRIEFSDQPPYHHPDLCGIHARAILREQALKIRDEQRALSTESDQPEMDRFIGNSWVRLKDRLLDEFTKGDYAEENLPKDATVLYEKFKKTGGFALRVPRVNPSRKYPEEHTRVVFSINRIDVPGKGHKVILGLIDCDISATDPQTNASKELTKESGREMHDLTHDEANANDAHLRRIYFKDADVELKEAHENYSEFSRRVREYDFVHRDDFPVPRIQIPKFRTPPPTEEEEEFLSDLLVQHYDVLVTGENATTSIYDLWPSLRADY